MRMRNPEVPGAVTARWWNQPLWRWPHACVLSRSVHRRTPKAIVPAKAYQETLSATQSDPDYPDLGTDQSPSCATLPGSRRTRGRRDRSRHPAYPDEAYIAVAQLLGSISALG